MALNKLPCRPTKISVECISGAPDYVKGGFALHISGLELTGPEDILGVYIRNPTYCSCAVFPVISGIVPVSAAGSSLVFSNTIQLLAFGSHSCGGVSALSGGMQEISAGVDLSRLIFCVAVKGK